MTATNIMMIFYVVNAPDGQLDGQSNEQTDKWIDRRMDGLRVG